MLQNITGHNVFLAENCISFNSKLWKPKPCVRLEQTLNAAGLALTMNKQASLQTGMGHAEGRMPLPVTDNTFQTQDNSTVLPILLLLKLIKFLTVYIAVVKYIRNSTASTHKLQNWIAQL